MSKTLLGGLTLLTSVVAMGATATSGGPLHFEILELGSITGTVTFSGDVAAPRVLEVGIDRDVCAAEPLLDESLLVDPESRGLMNVVVRITSIENAAEPRESDYLRALQQRHCRFEPHVLIVAAGREFSILNWDGILHNTHTRSNLNRPFNKAQPGFLKRIPVTLKTPETIEVRCDAHNWMSAWIVVAEHRFYGLTGELGEFRLEGVPPGLHELELWHETLGRQTVEFSVDPGKETRVDFEYPLPAG